MNEVESASVETIEPQSRGITVASALRLLDITTLKAMLTDCETSFVAFARSWLLGFGPYSRPDDDADEAGRLIAGELWARSMNERRDELIDVDRKARQSP